MERNWKEIYESYFLCRVLTHLKGAAVQKKNKQIGMEGVSFVLSDE